MSRKPLNLSEKMCIITCNIAKLDEENHSVYDEETTIIADGEDDSTCSSSTHSNLLNHKKRVRFQNVQIREYKITLIESPCCRSGAPIGLTFDYYENEREMSIEDFEQEVIDVPLHYQKPRYDYIRCCRKDRSGRKRKEFKMGIQYRRDILTMFGISLPEIIFAEQICVNQRLKHNVTRKERLFQSTMKKMTESKKQYTDVWKERGDNWFQYYKQDRYDHLKKHFGDHLFECYKHKLERIFNLNDDETGDDDDDEAEDDDNKHKHYDKKDEKGQELVVKKEHVLTNEEIDNFSKNTAHHDETELNTSYERIRRCPIEADTHEDEKVSLFVSQRKRIRTRLWKR